MPEHRVSSFRMNALATPRNSAKRGLYLAAAMLGILVLAFGVAPGTVLASSATDVYTEPDVPPTPTKNDKGDKNKNGGKGKKNSGKNKSGGSNNSGNDSSGTGSNGSGYSYDPGTGSTGDTPVSQGTGQNGSVNNSQGTGNVDQTDPTETTDTGDTSDETIAVTPAGGDSGGGGSALPMIIAILVGIPLIGGIAYYGWCRYRSRDDHLDSAFNDPPVGP